MPVSLVVAPSLLMAPFYVLHGLVHADRGHAMWTQISKTTMKYMAFYQRFVTDWWDHITYWQYVSLMIVFLIIGYMWMSKGATNE